MINQFKYPMPLSLIWGADISKKGCHAEPVEAWWAGLCAQPFNGAQGDSPFFAYYLFE
jgi:hypothetical protein